MWKNTLNVLKIVLGYDLYHKTFLNKISKAKVKTFFGLLWKQWVWMKIRMNQKYSLCYSSIHLLKCLYKKLSQISNSCSQWWILILYVSVLSSVKLEFKKVGTSANKTIANLITNRFSITKTILINIFIGQKLPNLPVYDETFNKF